MRTPNSLPLPKPEHDPTRHTPIAAGHRKKAAAGVRLWLVLSSSGQSELLEAGKHAIMRRTGLPGRDLRILDPNLSYPSTVLGRERAIVINLEHIKAIISAQEVLLLNSKDPSVEPFVHEVQKRILCHFHATKSQEGNSPEKDNYLNEENKTNEKQGLDGSRVLPFEFVVLETCLEAACTSLEHEAKTLELEAHPALDKLTSKISTLNLERVRQIKSRLVAITGRVQKVRDELEHLLDDDEDMAEMYLTEKLAQQMENSSESSINANDLVDEEILQADMDDRGPAEISPDATESYEDDFDDTDSARDNLFSMHNALSRNSRGTFTSTTRSAISKSFDVEELEMLLEAYFVQIDGTLNNLSTLREYVDDTEDYINIMLDDKQNHLLQMGVMLTTATLVLSAFIAVAGVFGMNIGIDMFQADTYLQKKTGMHKWLWTVFGGAAGTIVLYISAIAWCKHKRLLE